MKNSPALVGLIPSWSPMVGNGQEGKPRGQPTIFPPYSFLFSAHSLRIFCLLLEKTGCIAYHLYWDSLMRKRALLGITPAQQASSGTAPGTLGQGTWFSYSRPRNSDSGER